MIGFQAIDSLRHFAGKPNELQLLRDRVQELEELLGLSIPPDKLRRFKLSPTCRALLGLLYRGHNVVARASAYIAIYGARHECEQPEDKILDVHLSRIRKRLAAHQISIETHRGIGWFMTPENKARLRCLIDGVST